MEEYPNFLEIQGNGTVDGHDGNGGYDRGKYWYAKKFLMPKKHVCISSGGFHVVWQIVQRGEK